MHSTNEQSSDSALIGSIVIIAIIVVGGTYLFQNKAREMREERLEAENRANTLSNDDDLSEIEADLNNNADTSDMDRDLQ